MRRRILHVLSQRPGRTGSGTTLAALVRHAAADGWRQRVVVGVPAGEMPELPGIAAADVQPLHFGTEELPFPVPGMSDVMPYPSSVFSRLTPGQVERYLAAWRKHLAAVVAGFAPDVIHVHHVWLVASLVKDAAPGVPVVDQCHATGLRQRLLCPHLAPLVARGCRRNDRFLVLHREHAAALSGFLGVPPERITVVGAGYRDDLFRLEAPARPRGPRLLYVGKLADAKGLPWLLDAVAALAARGTSLELHVAGDGGGEEADRLRRRLREMAPLVTWHGALAQPDLAALMNRCAVCVLPSFYEGVPLVLVEAAACGCRLVATALPGIVSELAPALGPRLRLVTPPRLRRGDEPLPEDLPRFVADLADALAAALGEAAGAPPVPLPPGALEPFGWRAVYRRVANVWLELCAGAAGRPVAEGGP